MCWSAEASATFAALETAALVALCYRNRPRDRWYALAISPVVGQELCQAAIWIHIGATIAGCDERNAALTFLVRLVVNFIPLTFTVMAIHCTDRFARRAERGKALTLMLASLFVAARVGLLAGSFALGPRVCTTIGPNHHQVWADLLTYYHLPWWAGIFVQVPYTGIPVMAALVYLRPRWVAWTVVTLGCTTLACARILLPAEWESVWCWLGCTLVGFALVEPYVDELIVQRIRAGTRAA